MFDSQEYPQDRPQDLKKEKTQTFKNLGLVAAQCNGIAACTYSLKNTYSMVLTQLYMVCCILKPLFTYLLFGQRVPK